MPVALFLLMQADAKAPASEGKQEPGVIRLIDLCELLDVVLVEYIRSTHEGNTILFDLD